MRDYISIANQYIEDVLTGKIPACEWVIKACERQKRDLKTLSGYVFNPKRGAKVCYFVEHLRHTKGPLARQKIRLEPWQIFILTTVFGWVDSTGARRFKDVYIEVPRGNGKSALSSAIALYMLAADGEYGAECYSFATTGDQAKIVFDVARQMALMSPDVKSVLDLTIQKYSITQLSTGSSFSPKNSKDDSLDGLNTHFGCIDELHAHKTRGLYDVIETSIGKRKQPMVWTITTAGFDTSGICYEVRTIVTMILNQTVQVESQFGIIYTIDEGDDWTTDEALIKANPNWGVSVNPETLFSHREKALTLPSAANNFKTKYLNVWCSAKSAWMDMQAWKACEDPTLDLSDFEGCPCIIGLDLGAKNDITAKVRIFPRQRSDGKTEYVAFYDFYLPEDTIEKSTNSQYHGWVDRGFIHQTPGAMTDFSVVEEGIREDLSRFEVQAIAYDPWQATQLATRLSEDGAPMVEFRNTVQNMSDPMKSLEALVLDGRIKHVGNPAMNWMMGNVVAKLDAKDNIFPRKERYENKIDGPVAMIYALAMCMSDIETDEDDDFSEFVEDIIVI